MGSFFDRFFILFWSSNLCIISELGWVMLSIISIIIFIFVWIVCVNHIIKIISIFKDKWFSHLWWGMYMVILVVEWWEFKTILPSFTSKASFVWWLFYLSVISVIIKIFIRVICINHIIIIISVFKD